MTLEKHKYSLLLMALLILVVAPLVFGNRVQSSLIFGVSSLAVLLFGVLAALQHRKARVLAIALAILATISQLSSFIFGARHFVQPKIAIFVAFLLFIAVIIVIDVLRDEAATWDKIQGAVSAYVLFGVAWGLLYAWVLMHDPQAITGAVQRTAENAGQPMIYFSFVTLTTLGYGDITPVSHTARTLAWLEAAFGQIYLVVLVARLVSLQLVSKQTNGNP